jgi:hypothetical protein
VYNEKNLSESRQTYSPDPFPSSGSSHGFSFAQGLKSILHHQIVMISYFWSNDIGKRWGSLTHHQPTGIADIIIADIGTPINPGDNFSNIKFPKYPHP